MAAEANNRKTSADDAKAQNYLNQVRARAFGNILKLLLQLVVLNSRNLG